MGKGGPKLACCLCLPADSLVQDWGVISEAHLFLLQTWSCLLSKCIVSLGNYEHAMLQDWSYHGNFLAEGKDRSYFCMKALNQKNIAEWSKNLCQNPEIMDSAVSSCQWFSSLHGLKLCFWRSGLRFLSEILLFSLVHIITAAAAFSVWVRLERHVVFKGVGLCKNL